MMFWYDHNMGWWGYAGMSIGMVLFWGLLILGIVALVRYGISDRRDVPPLPLTPPPPSPEQILADRFAGRQPPRWLDEGIATMADSARKQTLHVRDCQDALRRGTALRIIDVLALEQFSSARQVPAFYGQSLSLVQFLTAADRPETLLRFAEAALENGYDRALRQHYRIDGVAALEREWRKFAANGHGQPASLVRTVGRQQ